MSVSLPRTVHRPMVILADLLIEIVQRGQIPKVWAACGLSNGPRPWDDDFLDKREALNANAD